MIEIVFKVLEAGLVLWNTHEARKYQDKVIKLKRAWYEEFNKDVDKRDHAVLDNIEFELRLISIAFSSSAGKPDTKPQS